MISCQELIAIAYKIIIISVLLLLALISDLKTYRISNSITFGFMLVGLAMNIALEGLEGLFFSLRGVVLPASFLMVLYVIRAVGAGDLKLLSAIGAVMGGGFALHAAAYSFICGGIIASGIILWRQNGIERFRYMHTYMKSCILSMELLQYTDFKEDLNTGRFHFSIAIAAGTAVAFITYKLGPLI